MAPGQITDSVVFSFPLSTICSGIIPLSYNCFSRFKLSSLVKSFPGEIKSYWI